MGEKTQTYLDNTGQNHYNYFAKMVFVCAPRNFAGAKERNDLNMANMKKEYKMSAERKEELQKELTYLKTVREKEVADLIKEARGFGDLSENAEYTEARNEQSRIEGQIADMEKQLLNAVVVDDEDINLTRVGVGTKVRMVEIALDEKGMPTNEEIGEEETFRILGSAESDVDAGSISNESPVGSALMGRMVGEKVRIEVPAGMICFEIKEISRA